MFSYIAVWYTNLCLWITSAMYCSMDIFIQRYHECCCTRDDM